MTMLAGVELGGTKCICVLGTGPDDIRAWVETPTTAPDLTLAAIRDVLADWDYAALGINSFGPLDLDPASPSFGSIITTPKPGWSDTDIVHLAAGKPFAVDTDVNGAALAEGRWGAAQGLQSWSYITVGTGIGVGSIVAGQPLRGLGHSEAGHMRLPRDPADSFPGICPYHADCLEGMANGPAIAARAGCEGRAILPDDPIWGFVAGQLGNLCHNLILTTLPQRILIGGGVAMGQKRLLPMIRERLQASLAGYGATRQIDFSGNFVDYPALGEKAGPMGALALAWEALSRSDN